MKFWKLALVTAALVLSNSVNASIIKNLNGIKYEWLEVTGTAGLIRGQVEAQLFDSNSTLFGYQYASRALVQDLFLSYAPWTSQMGFTVPR